MVRGLVIIALLASCLTSQAGNAIKWSKGSVVEKNGMVRIGEISFQTGDLILFKNEGQVTVYTPFHLRSFFYFDFESRINRKFSSMTTRTGRSFFEIVLWGPVQVIRSVKMKGLIKHRLDDTDDFNYFILWNNCLHKIEDFKKDVYPQLRESLNSFEAQSQNLRLTSSYVENVFNMIKLYNVLSVQGEAVARN